jgi:hypothetical protein
MPFWLVRISMEIDFITHCHVVTYVNHHHHQGKDIHELLAKGQEDIKICTGQ